MGQVARVQGIPRDGDERASIVDAWREGSRRGIRNQFSLIIKSSKCVVMQREHRTRVLPFLCSRCGKPVYRRRRRVTQVRSTSLATIGGNKLGMAQVGIVRWPGHIQPCAAGRIFFTA